MIRTPAGESVKNALEALEGMDISKVLIHDGARPLVPAEVTRRVLEALDRGPAAAPALPVSDALWRGAEGRVAGPQSREGLWRAQTPQGFRFPAILTALVVVVGMRHFAKGAQMMLEDYTAGTTRKVLVIAAYSVAYLVIAVALYALAKMTFLGIVLGAMN